MKKICLFLASLFFSLSITAQQQTPVEWYRLPLDQDDACKETCGDQTGVLTYDVPTYEQMVIIQEMVRTYIRQQVYNKRIPVYWNPETAGDIQWQSPPSVDWRAWRPQIKLCSKKMKVFATLPGGGTGWACATGIAYKDRIIISVVDPTNVAALVAWETSNNNLFWRLGLQQQPWPDGPMVGETVNWVMSSLNSPSSGKVNKVFSKTVEPLTGNKSPGVKDKTLSGD